MTELRFRLPAEMTHDDAIERLGSAGCTEPLAGVGRPGILSLAYECSLTPEELAREISVIAQVLLGAELLP